MLKTSSRFAVSVALCVVAFVECHAATPSPESIKNLLPDVARSLEIGMSIRDFAKAYPTAEFKNSASSRTTATVTLNKVEDVVPILSAVFGNDVLVETVIIDMYMTSTPSRSNFQILKKGLSELCREHLGKPDTELVDFITDLPTKRTRSVWKLKGGKVTILAQVEDPAVTRSGDVIGSLSVMPSQLYERFQKSPKADKP